MTNSAPFAANTPDVPSTAPAGGTLVRPAADLTAITQSDDFLLELAPALRGLAAVHPVDSLDAAIERLSESRRAQLLLVDARAVDETVSAVGAAATRAPAAIVLVCAPEGERARYAAALRGTPVFALVTTPFEPQVAYPVFQRAIAAAAEKLAESGGSGSSPMSLRLAADPPLAPARAASPPDRPTAGGPRRWLLATAAAAALAGVAVGAYWHFAGTGSAAQPPPRAHATTPGTAAPATPTVDSSIIQGRVDDLLEKARAAMRARQYTDPPGDNALLYYRSAAAADPSSGEARDGLQRIAGVLGERFEAAIAANQPIDAAQAFANLKSAAPDNPKLAGYAEQLAAVQAAAQRAALARRQADANAQHLADLVAARIRAGQLTGGEDSAKAYVDELQRTAPGNPLTAGAERDLAAAEQRTARDAALARAKAAAANADRLAKLAGARMDAGDLTAPPQDDAVYYLDQIRAKDPGYAGLAAANQRLVDALLARARAAARAGRPDEADLAIATKFGAEPAAVLAVRALSTAKPPASSPAQSASFASHLRLVRNYRPDYPYGALESGIGGSVVVAFTVDARGRPRDVHVTKASPPGTFDAAAIDAVSRWRYAPVVVDGKPVTVPASILIRFDPPK